MEKELKEIILRHFGSEVLDDWVKEALEEAYNVGWNNGYDVGSSEASDYYCGGYDD